MTQIGRFDTKLTQVLTQVFGPGGGKNAVLCQCVSYFLCLS